MGQLFLKNQTVMGIYMGRKEDLRQVVEMAGRGVIRGVIHQTFPLSDAAAAHEAGCAPTPSRASSQSSLRRASDQSASFISRVRRGAGTALQPSPAHRAARR